MDCDPNAKNPVYSIYTVFKGIGDPKLKTVVLWNTEKDILKNIFVSQDMVYTGLK